MPAPPHAYPNRINRLGSGHFHPGSIPDAGTAEDWGDNHDVVVNNVTKWHGFEDDALTLNSLVTRLSYVNSMFAQASQGGTFPAAWYMKNAAGSKLVSKGYGNFLMNPRGAASFTDGDGTYANWKAYVVKQAQLAKAAATDVDGVFLDMQGPAPILGGYLKPANGVGTDVPFNPSTGRDFTVADYLTWAWGVGDAVQAASIFVMSNGLGSGPQFYKIGASSVGTQGLMNHSDLAYAEVWMRTPGTGKDAFPTESRWQTEVQMLIDANLAGHRIGVGTKYWRTAAQDSLTTDAWTAQVSKWRRFMLCSALLGQRNGLTLTEFSRLESEQSWLEDDDYYGIDLGVPLAQPTTIAKSNGYYRLRYTNALVMVNPTTAGVTISASPDGRSYLNAITAAAITYPFTLAKSTGLILVVA